MYKRIIRPVLFLFPPETAHYIAFGTLRILLWIPGAGPLVKKYFTVRHPQLQVGKKGLQFSNPVGLAAGLDKNAAYINELGCLGFGFIEVGTVTPRPQEGNPRPRLFRLPADQALINRMGFNNGGIARMTRRLGKRKKGVLIGGNIGKNKDTPNESAHEDYLECFRYLHPFVDYFAVNVSSPNTPGLRALQEKEPLTGLLNALLEEAKRLAVNKPILLKIAPDLGEAELRDVAGIVKSTGISGVIATNTTLSRDGLKTPASFIQQTGAGGLSGKPLALRSTEVIRTLRELLGNDPLIIGVGGIHSAEDALEKLRAGADVVQLYTGFIYEGPVLVRNINKAILLSYIKSHEHTAA